MSGDTLNDIVPNQLPTEDVESYDMTLVVCMLNVFEGEAIAAFSETSALRSELPELCRRLRQHRRPVVILGGSADLWGFDPRWDLMVAKAILICRSLGIQAVDGVRYFRQMQRMPSGWHSAKTEANHAV